MIRLQGEQSSAVSTGPTPCATDCIVWPLCLFKLYFIYFWYWLRAGHPLSPSWFYSYSDICVLFCWIFVLVFLARLVNCANTFTTIPYKFGRWPETGLASKCHWSELDCTGMRLKPDWITQRIENYILYIFIFMIGSPTELTITYISKNLFCIHDTNTHRIDKITYIFHLFSFYLWQRLTKQILFIITEKSYKVVQ